MVSKERIKKLTRDIIDRENKISLLRHELQRLEAELDDCLAPQARPNAGPSLSFEGVFPATSTWADLATNNSIAQKVKHVFATHAGEPISLHRLNAYIPEAHPETLRATVSRLANKEGIIKNVDRGIYKYSLGTNEKDLEY